jgi:hypothetical protein
VRWRALRRPDEPETFRGNGHPLIPPWQVVDSGPDEVTMRGYFSRFHVGGNAAVHGE